VFFLWLQKISLNLKKVSNKKIFQFIKDVQEIDHQLNIIRKCHVQSISAKLCADKFRQSKFGLYNRVLFIIIKIRSTLNFSKDDEFWRSKCDIIPCASDYSVLSFFIFTTNSGFQNDGILAHIKMSNISPENFKIF